MRQSCILCGSHKISPAFVKGKYLYQRCSSCSALFIANKLSPLKVHNLYSEEYFEAKSFDMEKRRGYPSYREAQETLSATFAEKVSLIRRYAPSGQLLDAGAAYGIFLQRAKPYFNGIGLEISNFAASVANKEFGVDVQVGSIEKTIFPDNHFNVITMWDIIEHLVDPFNALKEVHRILKPGGYVFISTDDSANWLPRLLGKYWWAIGPPLHICHFSKQGIIEMFNRVGGFETIDIIKDKRRYSIPEIIKHFGISYENTFLIKIGQGMEKSIINKLVISIYRPEQFMMISRKIS